MYCIDINQSHQLKFVKAYLSKRIKVTFVHLLNDPINSFQVAGERYVYKFVCEPEALISLAFPDNQRPSLKAEFERYVNEEDTVPLSHLDEGVPYSAEQAPQNMGPQPYSKGYMY